MFKFVHAWQPGDAWEPLAADGFVGVQLSTVPGGGPTPPGVPVAGVDRSVRSDHAPATPNDDDACEGGPAYVIDLPCHTRPASEIGGLLARTASLSAKDRLILVTNTASPRPAARTLWDVLEAAHDARVKVAVDLDAAGAVGERAAVLVPTLNLRIAVVRAGRVDAELSDCARRLAGIGFDGYVVTAPPAGPDRAAASLAIAAAVRGVLPAAPAKKSAAKEVK